MVLDKVAFYHLCGLLFIWIINLLVESGVCCYWGSLFAGAFAYTDLLAPCASAMGTMLSLCDAFASFHGYASKTQLIYFQTRSIHPIFATILLMVLLCATLILLYIGHILTYDDRPVLSRI